jgi:hypothetical protein
VESLTITFPDESPVDARELAVELREHLLNNGVALEADLSKKSQDTADLGSILTIVLAAPALRDAVQRIADGIASWMKARAARREEKHQLTITVTLPDGTSTTVAGDADEVRRLVEQSLAP